MHTRHSGISILNKEALFDVEYERTNESNRIESRPPRAQSFNSIVLNIIFHAGVIQHDKSIEYITMLDIPARSIPIRLFHTRHVNW